MLKVKRNRNETKKSDGSGGGGGGGLGEGVDKRKMRANTRERKKKIRKKSEKLINLAMFMNKGCNRYKFFFTLSLPFTTIIIIYVLREIILHHSDTRSYTNYVSF